MITVNILIWIPSNKKINKVFLFSRKRVEAWSTATFLQFGQFGIRPRVWKWMRLPGPTDDLQIQITQVSRFRNIRNLYVLKKRIGKILISDCCPFLLPNQFILNLPPCRLAPFYHLFYKSPILPFSKRPQLPVHSFFSNIQSYLLPFELDLI